MFPPSLNTTRRLQEFGSIGALPRVKTSGTTVEQLRFVM